MIKDLGLHVTSSSGLYSDPIITGSSHNWEVIVSYDRSLSFLFNKCVDVMKSWQKINCDHLRLILQRRGSEKRYRKVHWDASLNQMEIAGCDHEFF